MFRSKLVSALIIAVILICCQAKAGQIESNWNLCVDGAWGDANNWSPTIVPDNVGADTFVVTIDTRSCANVLQIGLEQNRTIGQLDCYGEVQLEKWTSGCWWVELTIYNGLTNHGELDIDDLDIRGNITNLGGSELGLNYAEIEGNLYNQFEATIGVDYEVDVEGGGLENAGLVEIYPSGEIYVNQHINNAGQIIIYGSECGVDEGILDNNSTGVIKGFGFLFAEQLLQNKGAIYAYGGSLAVLIEGPLLNSGLLSNYPLSSLQIKPAEDVNNFGTIEINSGGGVVFDSNLNNEPNAVVKLIGGTLSAITITQATGATFEGQGDISTANLLIETNGLIRLTGPTTVFGDVQIDPNATLEISDGQALIKGHTTCNNGTIHMIGGRVICQGGLTNNNCNIIWEPGTYTNMADFNLDGTVNFKDFAYFGDTWLWQADWY